MSRLAMDVAGSQADFSKDPRFTEAREAGKTYFSPVYFRKESEPYMTVALAERRSGAGVTVAEVNLKFIWDVVSQIKIGKAGHAYVVDSSGQLIAHPDISLVLKKSDFSLPRAGPGGARGHGAGRTRRARDDRPGPAGAAGPDRLRADLAARLAGVRRAAARRGVRGHPRVDPARGRADPGRRGALRAGGPRCWRGGWSSRSRRCRPGAARIGAGELGHRIEVQDRRRAGDAGRAVQPDRRRSCRSRTPTWSRRSRSAPAS